MKIGHTMNMNKQKIKKKESNPDIHYPSGSELDVFLVPMLQHGNAYHMGSHAGALEPGNPTGSRKRMTGKASLEDYREDQS